jgi:hypothetical protein
MSTLVEQLKERFRQELAAWRLSLQTEPPAQPTADERSAQSVAKKRTRIRTASLEQIDKLEQNREQQARIEAATIELLAQVLIADETTQQKTIQRLAPHWPWSTSDNYGETPVLTARADVEARVIQTPQEATWPGIRSGLPWPESVDLGEVVEWVAEGLERHKAGSGKSYRNWCAGRAPSRVSNTVEPNPKLVRQRGGLPDALEIALPFDLFDTNDAEGDLAKLGFAKLVTGEQLAWLYWALPASIHAARAVRRQLGQIASGDAQKHLLSVIAPRAIREEEAEPNETAVGDLAETVRQSIKSFNDKHAVELPESAAAADQLAIDLDRAFATHIEAIGERGKAIAASVLEKSSNRAAGERWRLWQHEREGERFLVLLARALWADVVGPKQTLVEARRPAIVRAIAADRLLPAMTRQMGFPDLDDGTVRDDKGRVLARIALTTDATLEAVRRGAYALGTVTGNRLIRALIHRSHDAWNHGDHDPRRVAFEGGWSGLLEALGTTSDQHSLVKDIAKAGQCIEWETAHAKHGGLWLWSERRGTKAARGEVAFVLGDALAPGYADELARTGGNSLPARMARRLVPELRFEPPMGGARERDHGPIWTLHRLMLVEFVDHAEELAKAGSVVITDARWRELAKTAGVAMSIVDRTLAAWTEGESERAPALLEQSGKDEWTLAKPHEPERDFIAAGGTKRTKGRQAAQTSRRGRQ